MLIVLNGFAAGAALAASQEGDTKASIFGSKYTVTLGGYFPFTQSDLTFTGPGGGGDKLTSDDLGVGRITYGYSIIKKSNWDLVFNAGFHIVSTKATITASGSLSENGVPLGQRSKTFSSSTWTFPLPHIGGTLAYKFGPKVIGSLTGLIFTIDLGQYAGTLIEADAMVAYQITKHFGVGGGAKYYHLNLKDDPAGAQKVEFNMDFIGPAFFVYGNF